MNLLGSRVWWSCTQHLRPDPRQSSRKAAVTFLRRFNTSSDVIPFACYQRRKLLCVVSSFSLLKLLRFHLPSFLLIRCVFPIFLVFSTTNPLSLKLPHSFLFLILHPLVTISYVSHPFFPSLSILLALILFPTAFTPLISLR